MKHYNIPVFVPHLGCPHDCVFCSQKKITGVTEGMNPQKAKNVIDEYLRDVNPVGYIEIAFFGGSFTAIEDGERQALLEVANEYLKKGEVDGIRLSTRPDCISREILDELLHYGVTAIELGVQSMDDEVLIKSGRGHLSEHVREAVSLIREYPFELGLQMMTGLPGDTFEKSIQTARRIVELKPDTVRVYPTLVIRETVLCTMLESGDYTPFTLEETVELLAEIKEIFDRGGVHIIRMGLQTTDEITPGAAVAGGPYHAAIGELAENRIFYKKLLKLLGGCESGEVKILCNPSEVSKIIGHKRCNAQKIYSEYKIKIKLCPDDGMAKGELGLLR